MQTRSRRFLGYLFPLLAAMAGCSSDSDDSPAAGLPGESRGAPYDLTGFELPGNDFYPEGIAATRDGSLFVGSVPTGAIVRLGPGQRQPQVFVPSGDVGQRAVGTAVGMLADENAGVLWVCDGGAGGAVVSGLVGFALNDGHVVARHPFPAPQGFCNDVTLDQAGNVYATDSSNPRILRVAAANKLTDGEAGAWATDPRWAVAAGEFGLNGIEFVNGNVYAAHTKNNALYRIPAESGTGAVALTLSRTPNGLDGLKVAADGSLIFVEGYARQLVRVALGDGDTGTLTVLASDLNGPTTFTLFAGSAWVVEGQLEQYFSPNGNPNLPFRVVRRVLEPAIAPWP